VTMSTRPWPGAHDVHVWRAGLDLGAGELSTLNGYLSTEERDRAHRYHRERDATRYIAARGWLRLLLGSYVGSDPRALVFVQDKNGKPRLEGQTVEGLRFNVSHAGSTAVYAVACGREVGVDVEQVCGDVPAAVVHRFFSETERDALAALPAHLRLRGFFDCWTRKEAYVKATGVGMRGLAQADAAGSGWSLYSIDVGPDYAAALAIPGVADVPASATPLHLGEEITLGADRRREVG
jgi:4'-phosphopantetheinyl transferase